MSMKLTIKDFSKNPDDEPSLDGDIRERLHSQLHRILQELFRKGKIRKKQLLSAPFNLSTLNANYLWQGKAEHNTSPNTLIWWLTNIGLTIAINLYKTETNSAESLLLNVTASHNGKVGRGRRYKLLLNEVIRTKDLAEILEGLQDAGYKWKISFL